MAERWDEGRCVSPGRCGTVQGYGPRGMHGSGGIRGGHSRGVRWAGDMLGQKGWGQLVPVHDRVRLKLGGGQTWAGNGGLSRRARTLGGLLWQKDGCRRLGVIWSQGVDSPLGSEGSHGSLLYHP